MSCPLYQYIYLHVQLYYSKDLDHIKHNQANKSLWNLLSAGWSNYLFDINVWRSPLYCCTFNTNVWEFQVSSRTLWYLKITLILITMHHQLRFSHNRLTDTRRPQIRLFVLMYLRKFNSLMCISKSINIDSYQANLKAFIQHYSTTKNEHFTSVIKNGNTWYHCNG